MSAHLTRLRRNLLQMAIGRLSIRRRRLLAWRSMAEADVRSVTFDRDGITWTVSNFDHIGLDLFADGGYQQREVQALLEWMRRSHILSESKDVIVDIGANIGSTSIPIARAARCRVLAIEPVAENFSTLEMNVRSNGLEDQILLVRKAVQTAPGRVKMCLTPAASGGHFVLRDGFTDIAAAGVEDFADVDGETLTAIVSSARLALDEVALVWADVQGSEAAVIESGAKLWEIGVPLWAEVEPRSLLRQGSLETFATLAKVHFDRFIDARDLLRHGEKAEPVPISNLATSIEALTPEQVNTDVLFLPPRCPAQRIGGPVQGH